MYKYSHTTSQLNSSISDRIREARQKAEMTQANLADRLGVTQSTINRWESGRHDPSRDSAQQIAEALYVDLAWLEIGAQSHASEKNLLSKNNRHSFDPLSTENFSNGYSLAQRIQPYLNTHPVIAYQGVPGAYSHLASEAVFPELPKLSCASFEEAFTAVEEGKAELAMIPIENSLGGRVADIHHLLPESNLYIVGEYFQPVHHNLLAVKGATLETIQEARSHSQALAQTRETLRELRIKPVTAADTAGAAAEIATLNDPKLGAIASSLAAKTYGLEILRSRIEDKIGNVTRFILMARTRIEPDPQDSAALTSFLFTVRSTPAALYKSLGGFATNNVNMIKLESYIPISRGSTARFYAEIEGHPAEKNVDRAFEELQFFTNRVKILGTYAQSDFRF